MFKIKYILLIALLFSTSHAQYRTKRVGIVPFLISGKKTKKVYHTEQITADLSNSLFQYKFISLIDRTKMEVIKNEISLGMSGLIDESTVIKAGKIHGIEIMIVGVISSNGITGRAIDIETGKVISSSSIANSTEINSMGEKLASGIEVFIAKDNLRRLRNNSPDIELDFWAEKKSGSKRLSQVKIGQSIILKYLCNRNGYLTIVDIQPNGDVSIIFPNDLHPNNRIIANKIYSIPSKDDGFEIIISEPTGNDTLIAFFTKKKVSWLDRKKLSGEGFWTVKKKGGISMSRGFNITATKLKKNDWESKVVNIKIVK